MWCYTPDPALRGRCLGHVSLFLPASYEEPLAITVEQQNEGPDDSLKNSKETADQGRRAGTRLYVGKTQERADIRVSVPRPSLPFSLHPSLDKRCLPP